MRPFYLRPKHTAEFEAQPVSGADKTTIQGLISAVQGPYFAMRRFRRKPGGFMPKHTNTVEHDQYVLSGRDSISVNGQVYMVRAGEVVFIPESAPHWQVNNGDEGFEFLCLIPNQKDEIHIVGDINAC